MSLFKETRDEIELNSKKEFNCIPVGFNRFEPYFPGIMKAMMYLITASSGIGKSKFLKYYFIFKPIEYCIANDIKIKIFFFSLEESRKKFIASLITSLLYNKHGVELDYRDLFSLRREKKVDDHIIALIDECEDEVNKVFEFVEIVDHIYHGYGIFYTVREYAKANGKFYMVNPDGSETEVEVTGDEVKWNKYVPDDPSAYTLVITDHLSLMHPSKSEKSLWEAMFNYTSKYCITMRNKLGYTIINIQQQEAAKEKQEFTYKGQSIESKLEPSLDGLADCKVTARDHEIILGLFSPDRYEIKNHRGYDILELGDAYRSLIKMKDRDGEPNVRIGLWFKGAIGEFEELPPALDFECGLAQYSNYN